MMTERERLEVQRIAHDFTAALEVARDLADELALAVEELKIHTVEVLADDDPG